MNNGLKMESIKSELLENGYYLAKNIIPVDLLDNIRKLAILHGQMGAGVRKHYGLRQPHAFRTAPFIKDIFECEKLIAIISEVFESEDWFITNHADLHFNALNGWHKDDGMSYGDGGYFGGPGYHIDEPNVYKIAIYLQSHKDFDDGLTIVPRSHRTQIIRDDSSEIEYLEVEVGDILIFDARLSHTGQLSPIPGPRTERGQAILDGIVDEVSMVEQKKIPKSEKDSELLELFRSVVGERSSIFFTVATESEPSNIFAINNMKRQLKELGPEVSPYLPPSVRDYLNSKGVKSIDQRVFWRSEFPVS